MYMTFVNPLHQEISDMLVALYGVLLVISIASVACDVLFPKKDRP